ncbi:MAG: tetratricopeptide repeat protein [Deltaproteobacteria bacterium]|nr:tetratricopeptide repeat protein [Deltaproteobacteria bacterium]
MAAMDARYLKEREEFLAASFRALDGGFCEDAIRHARKRIERYPGDVDAWLVIAAALTKSGKFSDAEEILSELERILPGWGQIYEFRGDLYARRGNEKEALRYYRRALAPDDVLGVRIAGKMEALERDVPPVPDGMKDAPGPVPPDFQTVTLADLYIKQGHLVQAKDILTGILARDPSHAPAKECLAEVKASLGEGGPVPVVNELQRWLGSLKKR